MRKHSGVFVAMGTAIVLVALLAPVMPAGGRDSNAPKGASQRWLPCEGWAMYHWMPFDRALLKRRLKANDRQLRDWLRIDGVRPLSALAKRRGVDVKALKAELLEPWTARTTPEQLAELDRNVDAMFSQGHLASHMLFHTFHHAGLVLESKAIFGISLERYLKLRTSSTTNRQLARKLGIQPATAARRMGVIARRYVKLGQRRKLIAPAEARYVYRLVRARSKWWLDHRMGGEHGVAHGVARHLGKVKGRTGRACLVFAGVHDAKHQRHEHAGRLKRHR